jgi:hypothetical protein
MTQEQKELLSTMDSESHKALLALAVVLEARFAERVLNTNVTDGARALILAKAKLDGARELIDGMNRALRDIRKE